MAANPYDKAHELARSIIDSEIYYDFVKANRNLDKDPELKKKVVKFREMQMELNKAKIMGEDLSAEKVKEVTLEFAQLNREKAAEQFFTAEAKFVQMFTDVQEIIQKAIEQGLNNT